ncbi:MAG: hypothetical protein ACLPZR_10800 [Solirubrobacteraceae bacterium]
MRLRFTLLACALTACAYVAVPGIAGAAPVQNPAITIHAVPPTIIAGDPVLIYGHLAGPGNADQTIRLYHRINPDPVFSLIGVTRTDSQGRYEFIRPDGLVESNRSWYVRGPLGARSIVVHERVAALVSLAVNSPTGTTGQALVFSGHVTPDHRGDIVALQDQNDSGTGNAWHTLARTVVTSGSNFQFSHAWAVPGSYDVRALFHGDVRNLAAASDPVSVVIQQAEVPDFTITTSAPIVANQTPVTISGVLDETGTAAPEPSTIVGLYERGPGASTFHEVTTAETGADGGYQFANLVSSTNERYQVRTMSAPKRHSAALFEGVQDVLTLQSSSPTSTVGAEVTFSGTVSPDKAGHVIYLQSLGADGDWHTVAARFVNPSSAYQFSWTFGTSGSPEFRTRITGGPANVGNASAPVTVVVTLPPLSSLPTG